MLDIGWSELLLIAVVAILVVGPRDLPRMMRTVGQYVTKVRRMGRDLQSQFDDALREAELDEVRKEMSDLGRINPVRDVRDGLTKPLKSVSDDLNKAARDTERGAEAKPEAPQTAPDEPEPPKGEPIAGDITSKPADKVAEAAPAGDAESKRAATGS